MITTINQPHVTVETDSNNHLGIMTAPINQAHVVLDYDYNNDTVNNDYDNPLIRCNNNDM